ncbi:mitochondrial inner membrane i-AAA protease complex TPR repeat subunit Mgr3 [Schizosaccharomyces osmophilus]|uniref:Mitochondrial inner membrane i-AAA protease complex TPR repeat subunit Mgr3 n=1 Tax=Schizosaccharomyces osmophilus TaxID=2545709 RepID=A0AAE9W797_9SCHI|nr:mitochondrial inner membrane i-AAA protease complex TPR repeat subunit Mgr3 [Schizosaccharomyces osmophilus]WBW71205.1 mitochondrial inner membrane i-AAA protease complex TPR repeat subunit Mgr3 [Schizosaccharomyces osmophilus]
MRIQYLWRQRTLFQLMTHRRASTYNKRPFWRRPWPAALLGCAVAGTAIIAFSKPSPIDANYPASVARHIHEALYRQTGSSLQDFQRAWKAYQSAIEQAEKENMDMESASIQGIRLQMANLQESSGGYQLAWKLFWDIFKRTESLKDFTEQRVIIASKIIELSEPLGLQMEAAKAADFIIQSLLRNEINDEPENKSRLFEQTATLYFQLGKPSYAVPLYYQALELTMNNPTCHGLILMNNLATSLLAQTDHIDKKYHEKLLQQSRDWSQKAVDSYHFAYPKDRTLECHSGCAAAFFTLGQVAERNGNVEMAIKNYRNAESLRAHDPYNDGSMMAHIALDRLDKNAFLRPNDD